MGKKIVIEIEERELTLTIDGKKISNMKRMDLWFNHNKDYENYLDFSYSVVTKAKEGFSKTTRFDYDPATASLMVENKEFVDTENPTKKDFERM